MEPEKKNNQGQNGEILNDNPYSVSQNTDQAQDAAGAAESSTQDTGLQVSEGISSDTADSFCIKANETDTGDSEKKENCSNFAAEETAADVRFAKEPSADASGISEDVPSEQSAENAEQATAQAADPAKENPSETMPDKEENPNPNSVYPPPPPQANGFNPLYTGGAYYPQYGQPPYTRPIQNQIPFNQPPFVNPSPYGQPPVYPQPENGQHNFAPKQEPTEGAKKSKIGLRIFCIALAAVVVLSSVIAGVYFISKNGDPESGSGPLVQNEDRNDLLGGSLDITVNPKPDSGTADNNGQMSPTDIYNFVTPSVVEILVYDTGSEYFSYASGIIMSADGYIVSNDHIYKGISSPSIYVSVNGKQYEGTFIAGDSRRDISVIKIDAEGLTPAVFGKSSELTIGEDVYAIGNPERLEKSITNGIVSSVNRRVTSTDGYSERFIQTNAATSEGSSGGALVNEFGQVVGITSSKYVSQGAEGLCFAIPIDDALNMVTDLLANGKCTTRGKLAIRYNEVTIARSESEKCPVGLMVYSIDEQSSLYNSGIRQGDIITKVNGTEILTSSVMLDIVESSKAGDKLELTVWIASTKQYQNFTAELIPDEGTTYYLSRISSSENDSQNRQPLFPEDEEE